MDFLPLVLTYVIVFGLCVLLYAYGDTPTLANGPIGKLRQILVQGVRFVIPQRITDAVYDKLYVVLHTRNQVLQVVFVAIVLLGHAVWVQDMLPILFLSNPDANHTTIPLIVVFVNLFFYHKSCTSDPGHITKATLDRYAQVYQFDGRLYVTNRTCPTCNFIKPARSKHCNICNQCVHRFDHHCIWTNNDVGGLNHRYFLLFLLSTFTMVIEAVAVGGYSLWLYTRKTRLMEARVVLDSGETVPVNIFVVIQHLFLQYPRLVFLVMALIVFIPMVGSFLFYHTYLILTNQTTNERYKTPAADYINNGNDIGTQADVKSGPNSGGKKRRKNVREEVNHVQKPYSRGVLRNLSEVFLLNNLARLKRQ